MKSRTSNSFGSAKPATLTPTAAMTSVNSRSGQNPCDVVARPRTSRSQRAHTGERSRGFAKVARIHRLIRATPTKATKRWRGPPLEVSLEHELIRDQGHSDRGSEGEGPSEQDCELQLIVVLGLLRPGITLIESAIKRGIRLFLGPRSNSTMPSVRKSRRSSYTL